MKYFKIALIIIVVAALVCVLTMCGKKTTHNPELLKGANFVTMQNDVRITLNFAPNDMRVHGRVVNSYNGPYQVDGDKIEFGPFASTMMMGLPGPMAEERNYFNFMQSAKTWRLDKNTLTIYNADGDQMVFEKVEEVTQPSPVQTTDTDQMAKPLPAEPAPAPQAAKAATPEECDMFCNV